MRLSKLDGALVRARSDRREWLRFFRDSMYIDSELGRSCLNGYEILERLRKDPCRSGVEKERIFRAVVDAYQLAEETVKQTVHVMEAFEELERDRAELSRG
jgi:hypothetical protein